MKNWFIVQSHSNFENKVSSLIKEEAEKTNVYDKFEEIIVPTHDVTEVKRGKEFKERRSIFLVMFWLNVKWTMIFIT